ncbi:MAG: PEP-CTERM sorting domain-containing protein [Gallionella sp.]|nr:MAG: PEP-CTERM sorting domain-containing protein [Gallionella sp.]
MKKVILKKNLLSSLACGLFLLGFAVSGNAVVINFDDHPDAAQGSYGAIGSNYHGFDFGATNGFNRMDWVDTVASSWPFGAHSGDFTMLNNYGGDALITQSGGGAFTFTGLWIEGWGNYVQNGYLEGFLGSVSQYSTSFIAGSTFGYVAGSSILIDQLRIHTDQNFLVDDLELNGHSQSVPEPGTLLLLGFGLAGLSAFRKRFALK